LTKEAVGNIIEWFDEVAEFAQMLLGVVGLGFLVLLTLPLYPIVFVLMLPRGFCSSLAYKRLARTYKLSKDRKDAKLCK
jgi:hypothetical protein